MEWQVLRGSEVLGECGVRKTGPPHTGTPASPNRHMQFGGMAACPCPTIQVLSERRAVSPEFSRQLRTQLTVVGWVSRIICDT